MANYKEEIYIEFKGNYDEAMARMQSVSNEMVSGSAEADKLSQATLALTSNFKKFERALFYVNDESKEAVKGNHNLNDAIKDLEKSLENVEPTIESYNQHLVEVANSTKQVETATNKANAVIDKSTDKTNELTDAKKDLNTSTKETNDSTAESNILFQRLDEVTFGLASNVRDFVQANGGLKQAIRGNADEFANMTARARASTVAINTTKLALKALLVAGGITLLVVLFQEIVENWDKINKSIVYAFNPAKKLRDLELDKLKASREYGNTIDKTTERLRKAGKSELEILKLKQIEQARLTAGLIEEIAKKREDEMKSITFMKTLRRNTMEWLGDIKIVTGEIAKFLGAKEWGDNLMKAGQKNKYIDSVKTFEETDEGKELLEALDASKEAEARIYNELKALRKSESDTITAFNKERAQKIKEATELVNGYINEIAILQADTVFSKLGADWNKREKEIEKAQEDSFEKIEEAYKRHNGKLTEADKANIEGQKKVIKEKHDLELKVIEDEQKAYRQSTLLLYELQAQMQDGNLTLEQKQKKVNEFLESITNAEVKEKWTEVLGLKQIEDSIAFLEMYKNEMKDFVLNDDLSIDDNQREIDKVKSYNLALLEEQKKAAEEQAEALELSEKEKERILKYYKDRKEEIESGHNEASKELNTQRANQIIEYGQAASDGLSALGEMMGKTFNEQKNFATAQALISTFLAIANTLASASKQNPWVAIAQSVAIGLMGIAQVVKISQTTPENAESQSTGSAGTIASMEGNSLGGPNTQFLMGESQLAQTINNETENQPVVQATVSTKEIKTVAELNLQKIANSSL